VLLDLRGRNAVHSLRFRLWRLPLIRLPVAVGLVSQHAQGCQPAIRQRLAADLACALVAQQQTHGASCQRPTTGTREKSPKVAAAHLAQQVVEPALRAFILST
jgi:hypothetical protein